jgi:hypothetical protein
MSIPIGSPLRTYGYPQNTAFEDLWLLSKYSTRYMEIFWSFKTDVSFWPLVMTHRHLLAFEHDPSRFSDVLRVMFFWPLMMTHPCFFDPPRWLITVLAFKHDRPTVSEVLRVMFFWPWHKPSQPQTIFFHKTLPTVEGIIYDLMLCHHDVRGGAPALSLWWQKR